MNKILSSLLPIYGHVYAIVIAMTHYLSGAGNDWRASWRIAVWEPRRWTLPATPNDIHAAEVL